MIFISFLVGGTISANVIERVPLNEIGRMFPNLVIPIHTSGVDPVFATPPPDMKMIFWTEGTGKGMFV